MKTFAISRLGRAAIIAAMLFAAAASANAQPAKNLQFDFESLLRHRQKILAITMAQTNPPIIYFGLSSNKVGAWNEQNLLTS